MTDIRAQLVRLKKEEEAINEIKDKIQSIKTRDGHSFVGMGYFLDEGVAQKIEKYFKENGCYYVNVTPCGCAVRTYDILIQWL